MITLIVELYRFTGDGRTPNNALPVVIYRQAVQGGDLARELEGTFQRNGWTNNWRDIILDKDHYHATTHEVLGISRGVVSLQLGGSGGEQMAFVAGDVLIVPAGVGHFSLTETTDYEVVGGYPAGRTWDMVYNEVDKYEAAQVTINQLMLPSFHPLLGAVSIPGWDDNE